MNVCCLSPIRHFLISPVSSSSGWNYIRANEKPIGLRVDVLPLLLKAAINDWTVTVTLNDLLCL